MKVLYVINPECDKKGIKGAIVITGHVPTMKDSSTVIRIFSPDKLITSVKEPTTNSDGSFTTSLSTVNYWKAGTWIIMVNNDLAQGNTTFNYVGQTLPATTNEAMNHPSPSKIPNWVKGIFSFYAQGNLSGDDLIKALQFLIQQGIIKV